MLKMEFDSFFQIFFIKLFSSYDQNHGFNRLICIYFGCFFNWFFLILSFSLFYIEPYNMNRDFSKLTYVDYFELVFIMICL
jgi:hypothetical protein